MRSSVVPEGNSLADGGKSQSLLYEVFCCSAPPLNPDITQQHIRTVAQIWCLAASNRKSHSNIVKEQLVSIKKLCMLHSKFPEPETGPFANMQNLSSLQQRQQGSD